MSNENLITCPHCRSEIPYGANVCRGCRAEISYGLTLPMWLFIIIAPVVASAWFQSFLHDQGITNDIVLGASVLIPMIILWVAAFKTMRYFFKDRVNFVRQTKK